MWGDSFESQSFETGSWLFSAVEALRKMFNVSRVYVVSKVSRGVLKVGKRTVVIENIK